MIVEHSGRHDNWTILYIGNALKYCFKLIKSMTKGVKDTTKARGVGHEFQFWIFYILCFPQKNIFVCIDGNINSTNLIQSV